MECEDEFDSCDLDERTDERFGSDIDNSNSNAVIYTINESTSVVNVKNSDIAYHHIRLENGGDRGLKDWTDVVLVPSSGPQNARRFHSAILATCSPLLAELMRWQSDSPLEEDIVVILPDVSNEELERFQRLVYAQPVNTSPDEEIESTLLSSLISFSTSIKQTKKTQKNPNNDSLVNGIEDETKSVPDPKVSLRVHNIRHIMKEESSRITFEDLSDGVEPRAVMQVFRQVCVDGEKVPFIHCKHCERVYSYRTEVGPPLNGALLLRHANVHREVLADPRSVVNDEQTQQAGNEAADESSSRLRRSKRKSIASTVSTAEDEDGVDPNDDPDDQDFVMKNIYDENADLTEDCDPKRKRPKKQLHEEDTPSEEVLTSEDLKEFKKKMIEQLDPSKGMSRWYLESLIEDRSERVTYHDIEMQRSIKRLAVWARFFAIRVDNKEVPFLKCRSCDDVYYFKRNGNTQFNKHKCNSRRTRDVVHLTLLFMRDLVDNNSERLSQMNLPSSCNLRLACMTSVYKMLLLDKKNVRSIICRFCNDVFLFRLKNTAKHEVKSVGEHVCYLKNAKCFAAHESPNFRPQNERDLNVLWHRNNQRIKIGKLQRGTLHSFLIDDKPILSNFWFCMECSKFFPAVKDELSRKYHSCLAILPPTNQVKINAEAKKNIICKLCDEKFQVPYHHELHLHKVHGAPKKVCLYCGKEFITQSQVRKHENHVHAGGRERYCCTFKNCRSAFPDSNKLSLHVMKVHEGRSPFECEYCDKQFNNREPYKEHMYIHTGEKPYECDICHKRFRKRNTYYNHYKRHTGKKPFSCPEKSCNKKFIQRTACKSHALRKHKIAITYYNRNRNVDVSEENAISETEPDRQSSVRPEEQSNRDRTINRTESQNPFEVASIVREFNAVDGSLHFQCEHGDCGLRFSSEHSAIEHLMRAHDSVVPAQTSVVVVAPSANKRVKNKKGRIEVSHLRRRDGRTEPPVALQDRSNAAQLPVTLQDRSNVTQLPVVTLQARSNVTQLPVIFTSSNQEILTFKEEVSDSGDLDYEPENESVIPPGQSLMDLIPAEMLQVGSLVEVTVHEENDIGQEDDIEDPDKRI